ncbi:WD40/YVTN/BNR-like repeat-containing protein [Pseudothauera rhizosphaerae]|uniref:Exo-alpha-sialidase n=1 Tax=Pseudothauera rhizosphaerae TaxID=2565932 RepID=A0A4S4AL35_9RHOO|nr:exo-alpha-sialidase [Pseudothauera rhizosphaerae]THF60194.1 exo-alpha-sialidase [Pseudothauera rhizosphaerae]
MNDRLLIATRKGLFILLRNGAGLWQQAPPHFAGEPVSVALADPRDGTLYAALNLGHFGAKLWRSRDGGAHWEACAVPVYPPQPEAAEPPPPPAPDQPPPAPWSLQQIWALEAGGGDRPGVLWAGTIPGGLFRSSDGGENWTLVRSLWDRPERTQWFGGGYDHPGIHSICIDPRDSRHLTLAVSCGGVWQSADDGDTWTCSAAGMVADYMPPERREDPVAQDPHRLAQCAAQPEVLWVQHHNGIFRSTDSGLHWQRLHAQPSSFGFAVAAHPSDPDTAWFVPAVKDECRIPVDGRLVVTRTRDGGASFEAFDHGLPRAPAYDLVYRHGLAVDAGGSRLAMGSTTGSLWLSENGGEHWQCLTTHLPPIHALRFG